METATSIRPEVDACASAVLEVVPLGTRWLRAAIRRRQPSWSLPQLHTLGFLRRNPGASLSDLAGHLGTGLSTASTLVTRLVGTRQVDRREDPSERRKSVLSLTTEGQAQFDAALEASRAELSERLSHLSPEQLARVSEALALLHGVFGEG